MGDADESADKERSGRKVSCNCTFKGCNGKLIPRATRWYHDRKDEEGVKNRWNGELQAEQVPFHQALARAAVDAKVNEHMDYMLGVGGAADEDEGGPDSDQYDEVMVATPPCSPAGGLSPTPEIVDDAVPAILSSSDESQEDDDHITIDPASVSQLATDPYGEHEEIPEEEEDLEEDDSGTEDATAAAGSPEANSHPRVDVKSDLYLGTLAQFLVLRLKSNVSIAGMLG